MNFFSNLTLRSKLILSSLIPILGLLYYLQLTVRQDFASKTSAEAVIGDVFQIREMSLVLHEVQKERALTVAYLTSADPTLLQGMIEQQESTDLAISKLVKIQTTENQTLASSAFDSLATYRDKTRKRKSNDDIDQFYLSLKFKLLSDIAVLIRECESPILKDRLEEHLCLLRTKDYLAAIRSVIGSMIVATQSNASAYGDFASLKGIHQFNLTRFKEIASPDLEQFFTRKFSGPFVQQTYAIIQRTFDNGGVKDLNQSFDDWSDRKSTRLNSSHGYISYAVFCLKKKKKKKKKRNKIYI